MSDNNKPITKRQQWVLGYLEDYYHNNYKETGGYVSPTQVGRAYGISCLNKPYCHSSTGSPILKELVELGLVERTSVGYYRIKKAKTPETLTHTKH